MTREEAEKLVKRIRKADGGDEDVEPMLKDLALGACINLARIADALDRRDDLK